MSEDNIKDTPVTEILPDDEGIKAVTTPEEREYLRAVVEKSLSPVDDWFKTHKLDEKVQHLREKAKYTPVPKVVEVEPLTGKVLEVITPESEGARKAAVDIKMRRRAKAIGFSDAEIKKVQKDADDEAASLSRDVQRKTDDTVYKEKEAERSQRRAKLLAEQERLRQVEKAAAEERRAEACKPFEEEGLKSGRTMAEFLWKPGGGAEKLVPYVDALVKGQKGGIFEPRGRTIQRAESCLDYMYGEGPYSNLERNVDYPGLRELLTHESENEARSRLGRKPSADEIHETGRKKSEEVGRALGILGEARRYAKGGGEPPIPRGTVQNANGADQTTAWSEGFKNGWKAAATANYSQDRSYPWYVPPYQESIKQ